MEKRGTGEPPQKNIVLSLVEYNILRDLESGDINEDGISRDDTPIGIGHLKNILRVSGHTKTLEDIEDNYDLSRDRKTLRRDLVSAILSATEVRIRNSEIKSPTKEVPRESPSEITIQRLRTLVAISQNSVRKYTYEEILNIYNEYVGLRSDWLITHSHETESKIAGLLASIPDEKVKTSLVDLVTNERYYSGR